MVRSSARRRGVAFRRLQPPPPTVPPVLPDLTVKLINPPTSVSCSGIPVTCTATVEFTLSNLSSVDVTANFNVLIAADQVHLRPSPFRTSRRYNDHIECNLRSWWELL
jgi:hypothetical protein